MRTGNKPLNGRFASKICWLSSSVNNGATRTSAPPALVVFAEAGIAGKVTTGLTLKSEPEQAAVASDAPIKASQPASEINFGLRLIGRNLSRGSTGCQQSLVA